MLGGVNDRREQAVALAALLSPSEAFKVNLIPYNPTGGPFRLALVSPRRSSSSARRSSSAACRRPSA